MDEQDLRLPQNQQDFTDRFVSVCRADERIVAAFLGGSNTRDRTDEYSDLDLYLVTSDEAYQAFCADREAFAHQLGQALFMEDFGNPNIILAIFSDGTECDLFVSRESDFHNQHAGPYRVLLDKKGILAGAVFPRRVADPAAQIVMLRQQIAWFWHEFSHFTKAMGRGQLWFAYGEIEAMRRICLNLARLRYNFSDPWVGEEPHFKVEDGLPVEQLSSLITTCCPMQREAMLRAARVIFYFYQDAAIVLAKAHGLAYPAELERLLLPRLEKLLGG